MDNADRIRQWFDVIWNERELDRIPEFVVTEVSALKLAHTANDANGIEELTETIRATLNVVDSIRFKVTHVLTIDDYASAHWIARGSANGQSFLLDGLTMSKWNAEGKMVRGDNDFDKNILQDILAGK